MTEYDKTNTFVLFVNDKQGNDNRPDRTGTLNAGGVEYFMDGWIKQGKNGPFLSGRIKPKEQRAATPSRPDREADGDDDGDIPF